MRDLKRYKRRVWQAGGVCVFLSLILAGTGRAQTNFWNVSGDGYWDEAAKWTRGVPATTNTAVVIDNSSAKTVSLDFLAASSVPTLTISNMSVIGTSQPNTFEIAIDDSTLPFIVLNAFYVGNNGVVTIDNSVVEVRGQNGGSFVDDGTLVLGDLLLPPILVTTNVALRIGNTGTGILAISNAVLLARNIIVGGQTGARGILSMAEGTNTLSGALTIGNQSSATGTVWLVRSPFGLPFLYATNSTTTIGSSGVGQMTVSNATFAAKAMVIAEKTGSRGTLTFLGGTVSVESLAITNSAGRIRFSAGLFVSQGTTVNNGQPFVVGNATNASVFQVNGGLHTFADTLIITNNATLTGCGSITGTVLNSGLVNGSCAGSQLVFTGAVTNNAIIQTAAGGSVVFSGPMLNNGSIITTNGSVRFYGPFINNGTLLMDPNDDADGDGLPNAWEDTYGFNKFSAAGNDGGSGDPDGDGRSNAIEYAAGTNPLVAEYTDSWLGSSNGSWQDTNRWSLGAIPRPAYACFVTNSTTKTVTIDNLTVQNAAASLTISNLTVSAPGGAVNTLRLQNMLNGSTTPLQILNGFTIGTGGELFVTNSNLRVDGAAEGGWVMDGSTTLRTGSLTVTNTPTVIGSNNVAQAVIGSGTALMKTLTLGLNPGSQGSLIVANVGRMALTGPMEIGRSGTGTLLVGDAGLLVVTNSPAAPLSGFGFVIDGDVLMRKGSVTVSGLQTVIGNAGVGSLVVSNGTAQLAGVVLGNAGQSAGTWNIAGGTNNLTGTLSVGTVATATGTVSITAGQLVATNNLTSVGDSGIGQLTVSAGSALLKNLIVGSAATAQGTLTVSSTGMVALAGPLEVGGAANGIGTVQLSGTGLLVVTNNPPGALGGSGFFIDGTVVMRRGEITVSGVDTRIGNQGAGTLTVSGGNIWAQDVFVGRTANSDGRLTLSGGTFSCASLQLGRYACNSAGAVVVAGGNLFVTNVTASAELDIRSGSVALSSGVMRVDKLIITNACGHFTKSGGTLIITAGGPVLDPALDADADGLPNGWEQSYGLDALDITGSNGASGDPDGDGLTNLQEYQSGRNPLADDRKNDWISSGNGLWQETNRWSSGSAPNLYNQVITVTNATTKTVTLNSVTASSFTNTLTISTLNLAAPTGTTNTLALASMLAGGPTPLQILSNLTVGARGRITVSNSNLKVVSPMTIDGNVTLSSGSITNLATVTVGTTAGAVGSVTMTGGLLHAAGAETRIGDGGSGQFTVSNGLWRAGIITLARQSGSAGTLTTVGGTTTCTNLTVGRLDCASGGTVAIMAGSLYVTNAEATATFEVRSGTLTLTTGLLQVNRIVITNSCAQFTRGGGTLIYNTAVLDPAGDLDGDGLPTGWEQTYALEPLDSAGANGANGDPDGDGRTNLQEYLGGTNPKADDRYNSWTGTSNGLWHETSRWSSGSLPSLLNQAVYITNSTTKSVTINNTTASSYTNTLTIAALTISAPAGSSNTLALANMLAGGSSALQVLSNLTINARGTVVISNSNLQTSGPLDLNGTATVVSGSLTNLSTVRLGSNNNSTGTLYVAGGRWVAANNLTTVGSAVGSRGTLIIAGGTAVSTNIIVGRFDCTATGTVVVAAGSLFVTNAATTASLEVRSGTLTVTGGVLNVNRLIITNACAQFAQTGGTLTYGIAVLNPTADFDNDGLPNGWEQSYGFDPFVATGNNGPTGNPDQDDYNNLEEYIAGSSPISASSFPAVVETSVSGANVIVRIPSIAGRQYQLQRRDSPTSGTWADVAGQAQAGTGGVLQFTDTGGATVPQRVYRIKITP